MDVVRTHKFSSKISFLYGITKSRNLHFLKKINKYLFPSRLPFTKTLEDGKFNFLPGSIVIDSIISHKLLPILSQKDNYNMITT